MSSSSSVARHQSQYGAQRGTSRPRFPWPVPASSPGRAHADPYARRGARADGTRFAIDNDNGLLKWNICAGLVLLALVVVLIVFVVIVLTHSSEAKSLVNSFVPQNADVVQNSSPLLFMLRKKASGQTPANLGFLASTNTNTVALTMSPMDYAAAVRLVPVRQALMGQVSDQDSFKVTFVRDGLWLGSDGKLTVDPAKAAAISVGVSGRNGGPIRASDRVTIATAGSDPTTDPVASIFNSNATDGTSIVPFIYGLGC